MSELFDELAEEASSVTSAPSESETNRLNKLAHELAEVDQEIAALDKLMKDLRSRKNELASKELPDLMKELNVDRLGLPEDNVDIVLEPFYHANIKSDWPEDQRQRAFDYLESIGGGDLIKNIVTFMFGRGDHNLVRAFIEYVREFEAEIPEPRVEMSVPWNILTSFVREQHELGNPVELDTLGATVGTVVKIKKRKATK